MPRAASRPRLSRVQAVLPWLLVGLVVLVAVLRATEDEVRERRDAGLGRWTNSERATAVAIAFLGVVAGILIEIGLIVLLD